MAERTTVNATSGEFVPPPDEAAVQERSNPFPPIAPDNLIDIFDEPDFKSLPYEKRRAALTQAIAAVYDYGLAQPEFKDEHSADFGKLAGMAYAKLDDEHTLGEKVGETGEMLGGFFTGFAKDIRTAGVAAISAASRLEPGGVDPTKGAAQEYGKSFAVGGARLIDSAAHVADSWFSPADNELKDSLTDVRKMIDEGKAPVSDPAQFVEWLQKKSAEVLIPQTEWTATRLSLLDPDFKTNAPKFAALNQLSSPLNFGLLAAYVRTRDPQKWEQLQQNLAASPLNAAFGEEAQKITQSESGKMLDETFGAGSSEHLLSASDPLTLAAFLLPAARAAVLGKAIAAAEGGFGARMGTAALGTAKALPEQAALGAAMTLEHNPEASAGQVTEGATNMMVAGAVMHAGGVAVGEGVRGVRAARERFAPPIEGDNGPYAPSEPPIPTRTPEEAATIESAPAGPVRDNVTAVFEGEKELPTAFDVAPVRPKEPPPVPEEQALAPEADAATSGTREVSGSSPPPVLTKPTVPSEIEPVKSTESVGIEGTAFGAEWTRATESLEAPTPKVEATKPPLTPESAPYYSGVPIPKFKARKVTELDTVTMERSSRLQQSTQETTKAQGDLKKAVPSRARREALSVWREADGDAARLAGWEKAAKQEWMRKAAKTAQTLTPEEIAVARGVADVFNRMEARGRTHDVLGGHRDNYIPHVWKLDDPRKGFGTRSLKKKFAFAKARALDTFFDGDQAGFQPRTLDVADLVPGYIAEMNRVIADRQFVREVAGKKSKEGTPLVIPRGRVTTTEADPSGSVSHLVFPNAENMVKDAAGNPIDQSAYKVMEGQPALRAWRWQGKDTEGNPIFIEGDLALHPEAFRRIHAMLGESKVRKWYRDTEGSMQVPKVMARGLDMTQAAIKREMFGLLPPFHQVQEGTHAIGHLVNPFWGLKEFDLASPAGKDAARYTMLLSDKTSGHKYFEGVGAHQTLITQAARKFGGRAGEMVADVVEGYQKYIFGSYIPRLKFATYEKIRVRNTKRFADELKAGEITEQDIKLLSGQQTDAAYGHLNYAMLDRSPTVQHFMQLGLLAPDFLEARARFVGQAAKTITSKVGNEQFKAIAVLATIQAGLSLTLAQLTGGEWDPKHPFEFTRKGRRYTMRSVPEDLMRALAFIGGDYDTSRSFVSGRINPLAQSGIQLLEGRNYRGEKVGPIDTLGELGAKFIPMTARALPGIRELTETSRNAPTSPLEQFWGSVGIKISRHSPITETHKIAKKWMEDEKLDAGGTSYPVSKYQQLRYALEDSDMDKAAEEFAKLKETMTDGKIRAGFRESINHPFTQTKAMDAKFRASLKGEDAALYDLAKQKRADILNRFFKVGTK